MACMSPAFGAFPSGKKTDLCCISLFMRLHNIPHFAVCSMLTRVKSRFLILCHRIAAFGVFNGACKITWLQWEEIPVLRIRHHPEMALMKLPAVVP